MGGSHVRVVVALVAGIIGGLVLSHVGRERVGQSAPLGRAPMEESPPSPRLLLVNDADRPPVASDRRIYHAEDEPYLLGVIGEIFPDGVEGLSDEEICVRSLRYVTASISIGPVDRYKTPAEYLRDREASCGGFAMAFTDLVRLQGIPARYLGVFGLPQAGSHALAEAYHDDGWHLYDATFGILFYSEPEFDGTGRVLSAREVVTMPVPPTMMQVVSEPWQRDHELQRSYGVQPVVESARPHLLTYWNDDNRRAAFPIAFGNEACVSFPVRVDLRERSEFRVGSEDESWTDVYLESAQDPSIGYFYLGGTTPTAFDTLGIRVPSGSELEIVYVSRDADPPMLSLFPLDSMHLIGRETEGRRTTFRVVINGTQGIGLAWCPEGLFWVDALIIRRLDDAASGLARPVDLDAAPPSGGG